MKRIAKFYKVSIGRFKKDWFDTFGICEGDSPLLNAEDLNTYIEDIYNNIALPRRATAGSAGYDFYAPAEIMVKPGESVRIPTGIRAELEEGWVLKCYPRSGLGFKYRLQLDNTVGIIDSDYFYSSNEGHIFAKLTNDTREGKTVTLKEGEGFMQGIFVEYGITKDDDVQDIRDGGFGSTTKQRNLV